MKFKPESRPVKENETAFIGRYNGYSVDLVLVKLFLVAITVNLNISDGFNTPGAVVIRESVTELDVTDFTVGWSGVVGIPVL